MFKKEDIKVGMIVEIREYSKVFKEYLKRLYMLLPDYKGDLVLRVNCLITLQVLDGRPAVRGRRR